jgi:hypothetical protein
MEQTRWKHAFRRRLAICATVAQSPGRLTNPTSPNLERCQEPEPGSVRATAAIQLRFGASMGPRRGKRDRWTASGAAQPPFRNEASVPPRVIAGSAAALAASSSTQRSDGSLNRTQYLSDIIALVVLWRLRYKACAA